MNLTDINDLKNILRSNGFKPKDYLGQNFLVDEIALSEIVEAANLKPTDTVLEVGPGLGVLTEQLLAKAGNVIAVEKDPKLCGYLRRKFGKEKKLKLINDDILRFHLKANIPGEYKVVANIPYYLTSKLFRIFLESDYPPKLMVLMVQKEVGERVTANAGELSILGISVQIYSDPEIIAHVSKESFWPVPEVDSVILRIEPKKKYVDIKDKKLFFRIVKIAFSGKRKQIKNTIKETEALKLAKIDPMSRPQDLTIEEWIALYRQVEQLNLYK